MVLPVGFELIMVCIIMLNCSEFYHMSLDWVDLRPRRARARTLVGAAAGLYERTGRRRQRARHLPAATEPNIAFF